MKDENLAVFFLNLLINRTNVWVLKNITLTDKILPTSFSFAGGQNLETAEAGCRICFGGTKEKNFSKQNPLSKRLGKGIS